MLANGDDSGGSFPVFETVDNRLYPAWDLQMRYFSDVAVHLRFEAGKKHRMYMAGGFGGDYYNHIMMRGTWWTEDGRVWHRSSMMQEGPLIHSQILINHRGAGSADDELCMFGGVPLHTGVFQWHWPNNRNWDYHNNNNYNIGAIWCKKADTITSEGDGKDAASAWTRRGFLPQAARFYTKIIRTVLP